MRKYIRLALCSVQETITYRAAYLTNIFSSFVIYFVIFFIWKAAYHGQSSIAGMEWVSLKSYILVSLVANAMINSISEFRIARQVRSGNIAMDLLKPLDFQKTQLSITIGSSLSEGVLVAAITLVFILLMKISYFPSTTAAWLLFILSLLLSYLTKFTIVYFFGLVCFWTTSAIGIVWARRTITDFFSGALIPLLFFPDWLKKIADVLPFQGIVYLPASIFIGKLNGFNALRMLALQALWIIVLWLFGKALWFLAKRKINIQGG